MQARTSRFASRTSTCSTASRAEGAIADLILVDGDPVADISLIARPEESFLAIIKGGQLVKGPDAPGMTGGA